MQSADTPTAGSLAREGLWTNNPAMVQLLGLCPLLAVSGTFVTAFALGLTTLFVITLSNILISLLRHQLTPTVRLPMQILVIASFVTLADLLLQTFAFGLHQRIGLFVALIVTNCTLLGRAELFASRHPVSSAVIDGVMMGLGFLAVLVTMGFIRELLGHGTLFSGADLLLGPSVDLTIRFADGGLLLFLLPPGAFMVLGCLIALKNVISQSWTADEKAS